MTPAPKIELPTDEVITESSSPLASDDSQQTPPPASRGKSGKKRAKKRNPNCIGWGENGRQQTNPPSVPIDKLFPTQAFPVGEITTYPQPEQVHRLSALEIRAADQMQEADYIKIRKAAEVHRQVRKWVQLTARVGTPYATIANGVEGYVRTLLNDQGFNGGVAFPTGINAGFIAAHDSALVNDTRVVSEDVFCFDIGTHVDGQIVDSAWSMNFGRPEWDTLLEAVKSATNTGVREAGIDVRIADISAAIQEVMQSFEVEIDGKTLPVKAVAGLNGHSIEPFVIHGGKSVPCVAGGDGSRMEEGEHYAIETFGSTGRGYVVENYQNSHYKKVPDASGTGIRLPRARGLLSFINKRYGTVGFSDRDLVRDGQDKYKMALKSLVDHGVITDHPPLVDVKGCQTAQFEHTLILQPTCKEVVSRGEDY